MIRTLTQTSSLPFEWIDITNPTKEELSQVATKYNFDRRLVEDSLQPEHLPKYEMINNIQFLIIRVYSVAASAEADTIQELTDKIAIFIDQGFIITIHRLDYDFLSEINNTHVDAGHCQTSYEVLQRIINKALLTYDAPLAKLIEEVEDYESKIFLRKKTPDLLENLYFTKRKAYVIGKVTNLSRTILDNLQNKVNEPDLNNLRDTLLKIYTNSDQVVDHAVSLLNTYLSVQSQRTNEASQKTNEVVRVLTVFSVFFMPLTFIVGVYGMNFDNMPELEWKLGYYGVLGLCVIVAVVIYLWFKRKRWL
jgi:magnesium transporter